MMEFLNFLSTHLHGKSLYAVVIVVGCAIIMPQAIKVWDSWKDLRSGKREIGMEKMKLELLKLRFEIEILKKKISDAADVEPKSFAAPVPAEPSIAAQEAALPKVPSARQWHWVVRLSSRGPSRASVALNLLYALAWTSLLLFGFFLAFALYFVVVPSPDMTSAESGSTLIIFLPGLLGSYLAMYRLRNQRRILAKGG
jgi:hypothetical protein